MLSPFIHISDSSQFNFNVCPLAKQHILHFPVNSIKSQKPFDMMHCDIWGKFSVPNYKGFQYFLTIVDDFSRCTWIFLTTHKSDTYSLMKHFLMLVKTQFNSSVKTIRSDNGTEFCSNEMTTLFSSIGIIHQTSCVYTP